MQPTATIAIITRNRRDELRRALRSAMAQSGLIEILVIDDGSTDGTSQMIASEFASVRLESRNESKGLIVRRNEAAYLAQTPVLVSIDDDAEFSSSRVVEQTLADFDNPRIGAVAIPFVNVRRSPQVQQQAPRPTGTYITDAYIGTAYAVRCDVFLEVGGYREKLVHQGEEGDFCVRMLEAGFNVRLGRSDPINHYESAQRDFARMDFYGRRNDVLFSWYNVPWPYLPVHLVATTLRGLAYAITRAHHPIRMIHGTISGFCDCLRYWNERHPVSRSTYRLSRRLKKRGPWPLAEVEKVLTTPATSDQS